MKYIIILMLWLWSIPIRAQNVVKKDSTLREDPIKSAIFFDSRLPFIKSLWHKDGKWYVRIVDKDTISIWSVDYGDYQRFYLGQRLTHIFGHKCR